MLFLSFSNSEKEFGAKKLTWRSYTVTKVLSTAKRVELINKREFVETALDKNANIFAIHITALKALESAILMYFLRTLLVTILQQ